MSYSTINKSTKRRRYLEELELIELYDESVHSEPASIVQPNLPSYSGSLDLNSSLPTPNLIHNLPCIDDIMINMCNDEYDAISISSNSDIEDESCNNEYPDEHRSIDNETDSSILNNLAKWAVSYNVSQVTLSALLKLLKTHKCHNYFPIDARTILKTKSSVQPLQIQTMTPGSYYYFSIFNSLKNISNSDDTYFVEDKIRIVIGIDGLPLTKSSSSCFWPILGYVRHPVYKPHVFLIGLYWGKDKPLNCNPFLLELVNETKELYQTGFQTAFGIKQVVVDAICCDLPAKSFILKTKGHTGYYSCSRCLISGFYFERRVCFPGTDFITKRTHIDFLNRTDEEFHMTDEVSIITEIPGIDIVNSVSIDYMHLVCLGVTKKIILLWLGCIKNAPVSVRLQSKKVNDITKGLLALRPSVCSDFSRFPRGLNEVARWKATEFRQFLLYTGPVVLQTILNNECYLHFLCLHVSFRILLAPNVDINLVNFVEKILTYFVDKFCEIYGKEFISLNVHNLLHIVDDYKKFGALDSCSCFPFENYMKTLKKMIRKHEKPLEQVIKRYHEFQMFGEYELNTKSRSSIDIKYLKIYSGGPLPEECIKPEFKIAIKDSIKINIKSFSDAYIGYTFGGKLNIFKVVNICVHKVTNKKVFVTRSFKTIQPFYEKPINSMKIGIAIVNELSNDLLTIDIETCNYSKYVILNNSLGKVAFPILHSSNN